MDQQIREATAIGDLNSDAKGTGARKNEGKPAFELIPVRLFLSMWGYRHPHKPDPDFLKSLEYLADFQEGNDSAILDAIRHVRGYDEDAARVLDYGRNKYAAWNWAKGMDWSVCFGCALRHAKDILRFGMDSIDAVKTGGSGDRHVGHYLCNLIFLEHYSRFYKEGDDRPSPELFRP